VSLIGKMFRLPFAWAVRETGTFLMAWGNPDDVQFAESLLLYREKYSYWLDQRYYWFNGMVLSALEAFIERLNRYAA
jgi:hypothetical protein